MKIENQRFSCAPALPVLRVREARMLHTKSKVTLNVLGASVRSRPLVSALLVDIGVPETIRRGRGGGVGAVRRFYVRQSTYMGLYVQRTSTSCKF